MTDDKKIKRRVTLKAAGFGPSQQWTITEEALAYMAEQERKQHRESVDDR